MRGHEVSEGGERCEVWAILVSVETSSMYSNSFAFQRFYRTQILSPK